MHALRFELHNELHSRPSIYFNEPAHVFHLALLERDGALEEVIGRLYASPATDNQQVQQQAQGLLKLDGHDLKWERHTEFLSLTLVVPRSADAELWPTFPESLTALVRGHEHLLINATQILVESEQSWAGETARYGFKDPAGSHIGSGDAIVWSDFKLTEGGSNRLLLINRSLNAYRLGRMVRRLLEIETYRMMASLALPVAKEVSQQLKVFDEQWARLSDQNAIANSATARLILSDISALSARIVRTTAQTRQRFSAAEAYAQIVFERIAELRESHLGDCQRLGVFIERRFKPTVRYCLATNQRLERLSDSVANLGELLQARVQVEVEEQNTEILHSLHTRATTQIKIQKAVEGLSIIAITYYLLSLFKLLYGGLHSLGLDISPKEATLFLAPLAVLIIGATALRIRKAKEE
ncbi:DUF3422 domain-containing protein [Pseudomonas sp. LS1212]|uniref:DUF3422 domain-containing protein n=1 Tax=Pseudomonas sp. LS1212 TaxID=2972478 RepID=UPI00215BA6DF|nr:DUF3422 domain-containing protein [Pseudomonas sp. LS1212]UVJ45280.1 DUF3422 domain-containing protein [Pseudomonas sp. LS1212]